MQLRFAGIEIGEMRGKPTRYISIPAGYSKTRAKLQIKKAGHGLKRPDSKVTQSIRGEGESGELPFGHK